MLWITFLELISGFCSSPMPTANGIKGYFIIYCNNETILWKRNLVCWNEPTTSYNCVAQWSTTADVSEKNYLQVGLKRSNFFRTFLGTPKPISTASVEPEGSGLTESRCRFRFPVTSWTCFGTSCSRPGRKFPSFPTRPSPPIKFRTWARFSWWEAGFFGFCWFLVLEESWPFYNFNYYYQSWTGVADYLSLHSENQFTLRPLDTSSR